MLQILRSNHDVRFLVSSAHELYFAIKYSVKDQQEIDKIAAISLAAFQKKVEKEKLSEEPKTCTKIAYGRLASMAYARSELIEVEAVMAVHYLLHGTAFVCSHDFQTLHLGRHLIELSEIEHEISLIRVDGTYNPFNVTMNYKLRPLDLENFSLY